MRSRWTWWLAGSTLVVALVAGVYSWLTALTGPERAIVDGTLTLHRSQSASQLLLKRRGLTLWESTRWKDVFDTNGFDEVGKSLSVEYGFLGVSNSIWGSALPLTFEGQGTIHPGDSIEKIMTTLGPPRGRLKRASKTILIYGGDRLVLIVGADGYNWFSLSDRPIDIQTL